MKLSFEGWMQMNYLLNAWNACKKPATKGELVFEELGASAERQIFSIVDRKAGNARAGSKAASLDADLSS
ncbi:MULTISPECIES: hypothetical protein [unclassified Pseudomonas]|uniref:hypothetical protein n=1 Tax=unclassified Pseudomonas TaxID=196821 RepID=UPI00114CBB34|nr:MULTISPECIES: hypothetical protein [unclassified Pseudomonas]MCP1463542.1 hypothetical protein [Pseudomonas sp. S3E17]